jgi:hypothetical protein
MHDTGIIIRNSLAVYYQGGIFVEVIFHTADDVLGVDRDVIVSVWSRLLVIEADRVTKFVDHDTFLKEENYRFKKNPDGAPGNVF